MPADQLDEKKLFLIGFTKGINRCVAAVYDAGTSSMSEASLPYLPLFKTTMQGAASINLDNTSGYVSASWEPVNLAEGYKVLFILVQVKKPLFMMRMGTF